MDDVCNVVSPPAPLLHYPYLTVLWQMLPNSARNVSAMKGNLKRGWYTHACMWRARWWAPLSRICEPRGRCWDAFSGCSSTLFFRQTLYLNLELAVLARLSSQGVLETCLFPLPVLELEVGASVPGFDQVGTRDLNSGPHACSWSIPSLSHLPTLSRTL